MATENRNEFDALAGQPSHALHPYSPVCQGFRSDYVIDPEINGKKITQTAQVRMVGNSVAAGQEVCHECWLGLKKV